MQADLFGPVEAPERGRWPSEQLAAYMAGDEPGTPAIRSWAAFYIWQAAQQISAMPTIERRRAALAKVPKVIRPRVQDDMRRIWAGR